MEACCIGDAGAAALTGAGKAQLRVLNLECCYISDTGVEALAGAGWAQLRSLELQLQLQIRPGAWVNGTFPDY